VPEVIMVLGCPASGKSSLSEDYIAKGAVHINRDKVGGATVDLVPAMEAALNFGNDVVLDNTFPTVEMRKPFIDAAKKAGAPISCVWLNTSIEDAQINALFRMIKLCGHICFDNKMCAEAKHVNIFPPAVLFKYRKQFKDQKPTTDEGFTTVTKVKFVRQPLGFKNKAIIFDYDGTLRDVLPGAQFKYPIHPREVELLPGRNRSVIKKLEDDGYKILGVSNQSGVGKGNLTYEMADACFVQTNMLLDSDIDFRFCHHSVPPISCYCRKPQSGLGIALINDYKLDPAQCIMVGDFTSDKTFATRLGFQYVDAEDFFND